MKAQLSRIWKDWSESKLNLLFRCPLAFKLNYLERVAVPQSVEKVFGATIHYFLKRFFALKYGYKSPESFSRSFVGFWKGVLEGRHGPGGYNTPPVPLRFRRQKIDYFGLGIALLKQFYQENQSFLQGPNERPRYCETRLVFPFSGFRLTAILDRIQPEGGGETIYDYKTSVFQKSEIERAIDTQFTFYSLAYLKKFGQPPQRLALWYLRPQGSEIIAVPPRTTAHYQELSDKLQEASRFVQAALLPQQTSCLFAQKTFRYFCLPEMPHPLFLRRDGTHCRFCDFDKICLDYPLYEDPCNRKILRELQNLPVESEIPQLILPHLFF